MTKPKCSHCGSADAPHTWDMRPCAIGKSRTFDLCDGCDLELNRYILAFFQVPDGPALLAVYKRDQ